MSRFPTNAESTSVRDVRLSVSLDAFVGFHLDEAFAVARLARIPGPVGPRTRVSRADPSHSDAVQPGLPLEPAGSELRSRFA